MKSAPSKHFLWLLWLVVVSQNLWGKNILLDENHGGEGSAWGLAQCDACHLVNFIHANTTQKLRELVQTKGYSTCSGCHGLNGVEPTDSIAGRVCITCHNAQDLPYASGQDGRHKHDFNPSDMNFRAGEWGDRQCVICHEQSDMDGVFDLNTDLTRFRSPDGITYRYKSPHDFCLACHNRDNQQNGFEMPIEDYRDPLVAMEDNYTFIDKHGQPNGSGQRTYAGLRSGYQYGSVLACSECHAMHGSDNQHLIIDQANNGAWTLSSSLKQQNIPVNIEIGGFAQLCVLCHDMNNPIEQAKYDTGNGLSGVHQSGGKCLDCHRHGMAIQTGL